MAHRRLRRTGRLLHRKVGLAGVEQARDLEALGEVAYLSLGAQVDEQGRGVMLVARERDGAGKVARRALAHELVCLHAHPPDDACRA